MSFQKTVNITPAVAVAGDFASDNPRSSLLSVAGGIVAGTGGVNIGMFSWVDANGVALNNGSGTPDGLIPRAQLALNTAFLQESGSNIPAGYPVTVMNSGDMWVKATVGGATKGQKAFAKLTDGTMQAAAAGATVSGFVETPFWVATTCAVNELCKLTTLPV